MSSRTPCGSIIDSHLAFETSKTCLPNVGLLSPTKRFGSGVRPLVRITRGESRRPWVSGETIGFSMKSPYRFQGQRHYLWRAVDQDGDVIEVLVQKRKDTRAAKRFFIRLLKSQRQTPIGLTTDRLGSYRAAKRQVMPSVAHCQDRYANNRAEVSHEHTRAQERQMRGFRSDGYAQRFLSVHGQFHNLFRLGRHLLRATNYRVLRSRAFGTWSAVNRA